MGPKRIRFGLALLAKVNCDSASSTCDEGGSSKKSGKQSRPRKAIAIHNDLCPRVVVTGRQSSMPGRQCATTAAMVAIAWSFPTCGRVVVVRLFCLLQLNQVATKEGGRSRSLLVIFFFFFAVSCACTSYTCSALQK